MELVSLVIQSAVGFLFLIYGIGLLFLNRKEKRRQKRNGSFHLPAFLLASFCWDMFSAKFCRIPLYTL